MMMTISYIWGQIKPFARKQGNLSLSERRNHSFKCPKTASGSMGRLERCRNPSSQVSKSLIAHPPPKAKKLVNEKYFKTTRCLFDKK